MQRIIVKKLLFVVVCLLSCINLNAQMNVKGTVISADDGEPIVGAYVIIAGEGKGTTTNIDGKFELAVPEGKKLTFSYVGMQPQTLAPKSVMKIYLREQKELKEIVVTGMTKLDRRLFTGATDQIKADDAMIAGVADISRSLEGRSAGVSVQNLSGTFGTAPKIRVRGATSIYGSSKPLWVVDGVIMEDIADVSADALSSGDAETLISSAIAGLNSDDIESFQILKDGSATSIYGARAMAGVIVVTTKKGKSGQAHLSYSGEFTTRLVPSYSQYNILNSQDQMGIYRELYDKGWLSTSTVLNGANYGVYGKMYELTRTYDTTTGQFALLNTQESLNAYLQSAERRNTNWFNELFSSSILQNHSVSLSGGTDKSNYYASVSAMVDPGWYKDSDVKRYTINSNTTHKILNNLSVNIIGNASYRQQKAPGTMGQATDIVNGEVKRDFDINPFSYALKSSRALDPDTYYVSNYAPFNIHHELASNYMKMNVFDAKFQTELKWSPFEDLELSALGALKYSGSSQEHYVLDDSNVAESYRAMSSTAIRDANSLLYKDPDNLYSLPVSVLESGGTFTRIDNRMVNYDFRATATYNHTFDNTHIVNLFAGAEYGSTQRNKTYFKGWGMQYSLGCVPFYDYKYFKKGVEENSTYYYIDETRYRFTAFFANGTYSYKGKYTANATIRYEGSNVMGKSRQARWLPTWNIAGSWNVHDEEFFEPLKPTFSHFTLKASYSLTADRGPADITNSTAIFMGYTPWRLSSGNKETAIAFTELENSNLTYEKKHEWNVGFEAGFLENRINVTFDIYGRRNFDLIGAINTMGIGGQTIKYGNVASMKSSGQELSISTTNIKNKDFTWQTNFIFSHTKNEVTELMANSSTMDYISGNGFARVGYPVRALFSIPFMGLDENGYPTFLNEYGEVTSTNINFQNRTNNTYLKYEGPTDPTITGSLGNVLTYKNWKFNVFVTYSMGNVVRLNPVFSSSYNDLSSMTKEFKNRWMLPGDEAYTNVPTILSRSELYNNYNLRLGYNAYNYSTERVAKGDFIRLKEISVAYTFPKQWFEHTPVSSLSLKLQATDLLLLYSDSKLNGQDPEYVNAGGVSAPMPRQFTLTVKAGF